MSKYRITFMLVVLLSLSLFNDMQGQDIVTQTIPNKIAPSSEAGFGYMEIDRNTPCTDEINHLERLETIRTTAKALRAKHGYYNQLQNTVEFSFPLATSQEYPGWALHGVSNYVDHNSAFPDQLQDYMCGTRTYDTVTGYNHRGVDYFTWPFGFYQMDMDEHHIVASAAGLIISKTDGNTDRNCSLNDLNWNSVYVLHDDNSVAWYGHMKRFSTTDKEVGEFVERGEYLGTIGSSGSSTGPHLHLEFYDAENELIDPFEGPCNTMNSNSFWDEQHDYQDSAINMLATHSAPPEFFPCPQSEVPNFTDTFNEGDEPIVAIYFRDQKQADTASLRLRRPNGSLAYQWSLESPDSFVASYWYWVTPLPPGSPLGTYAFEVTYNDVEYIHEFEYGGPPVSVQPESDLPRQASLNNAYPNPFNPTTNVEYELSEAVDVRLEVFNALGQRVSVLYNGMQSAGIHTASFDGSGLTSGIYLVRMQVVNPSGTGAGGQVFTNKMMLVK